MESFPLFLGCAPVSVAEYASISLNMPINILENSWINYSDYVGLWIRMIIFHVWQSFEARVLKWRGYIWKDYAEFRIRLTMTPPYASIIPEHALIPLNMPKHIWILLNVLEYAWKFLNKLFWLCQGSQYATI